VKKILVLLFVFLFAFTVYAQEEAPLFEWNGTGMKNTEVFEVKSPWRIVWNVTKEPFEGAGLLQVYLNKADGSMVALPINQLGAGEGETWMHKESGKFYFEIISANCDWEIKIFK